MSGTATQLAIYLHGAEPRDNEEDFLIAETPEVRGYLGPTPGPILAPANELAGLVEDPAAGYPGCLRRRARGVGGEAGE